MTTEVIRITARRDFDPERELARERAQNLIAGKWSMKVNVDPVIGLDLSTYRCGMCGGRFPERCFALMSYEHDNTVYIHWGCWEEKGNWAYDPSTDDYPGVA